MKKIKARIVALTLVISLSIPGAIMNPVNTVVVGAKPVYVYYARYSKKFHSSKGCRTLARSKKIYKATKKNAKRKNLTACKVCY